MIIFRTLKVCTCAAMKEANIPPPPPPPPLVFGFGGVFVATAKLSLFLSLLSLSRLSGAQLPDWRLKKAMTDTQEAICSATKTIWNPRSPSFPSVATSISRICAQRFVGCFFAIDNVSKL